MDRFGPLLGIIVVVVLVVGCLWAFVVPSGEHGDNSSNKPYGIHFICPEDDCGHKFTITVEQRAEYNKAHWGESYPCEKCGRNDKPIIHAERCRSCDGYYPIPRGPAIENCPLCKEPITS